MAISNGPSSCICKLSIHLALVEQPSTDRLRLLEVSIGPSTTRPAVEESPEPILLITSSGTHTVLRGSGLIHVSLSSLQRLEEAVTVLNSLSWKNVISVVLGAIACLGDFRISTANPNYKLGKDKSFKSSAACCQPRK